MIDGVINLKTCLCRCGAEAEIAYQDHYENLIWLGCSICKDKHGKVTGATYITCFGDQLTRQSDGLVGNRDDVYRMKLLVSEQ